MDKYINGGIVKEITIYLKKKEDLKEAFNKLGKYLDINLYDMKVFDQAIFLELDEVYIKNHLLSFLKELQEMKVPSFIDYGKKIRYVEKHFEERLATILENCDDIFQERFRMFDTFSINDDSFCLDVLCYVFYFDGPYEKGNYEGLLQYLHVLQKNVLKNPLRGTLCFGIRE